MSRKISAVASYVQSFHFVGCAISMMCVFAGADRDIAWPSARQAAAARSVDEAAAATKRAAQRKGVQASFAAVTAERAAAMLKALAIGKPLDKMESVPEAALEDFPSAGQLNETAPEASRRQMEEGESATRAGEMLPQLGEKAAEAGARTLVVSPSAGRLSELGTETSEGSFVSAVSRYEGDVGSEAEYGSIDDVTFDRSYSVVSTCLTHYVCCIL